MDLSVVLCTYNRAETLRGALEALARQEVPSFLNWEIVVVDNNSDDRTRDVVAEFARESPVPVVSLFEKRQGLSFARNRGVAHSRAAILAFMDDDVRPARDWVRSAVEAVADGNDGVGGRILPEWRSPPPRWLLREKTFLTRLALLDSEEFGRVGKDGAARVFGANMAFRREVFDSVGLFDPALGRRGKKLYSHDETDFVERAVRVGKKIVFDPRLIVMHTIGPERLMKDYFRRRDFDEGEHQALRLGKPLGFAGLRIAAEALARMAANAALWLAAVLTGGRRAFRAETRVWKWAGFLWGRLQLAFKRLGKLKARIKGEYDFWRVKKLSTAALGPQYRRSRRLIEIDITYACNLNCYNCNRSCEQAPTGAHMSVAQIRKFVDESVEAGTRWGRIRLLGGEPTLHKDFFQILNLLRAYRDAFSPGTEIEVCTNGHGPEVRGAIDRIPKDVRVADTAKESKLQPSFESFNVAPMDLPEYAGADFRNGCGIIEDCGFGLGPGGYYPCAIAGGIDRVLGAGLGRGKLPSPDDSMQDLLTRFCRHCGHFKRRKAEKPLPGPAMSPSWRKAYGERIENK